MLRNSLLFLLFLSLFIGVSEPSEAITYCRRIYRARRLSSTVPLVVHLKNDVIARLQVKNSLEEGTDPNGFVEIQGSTNIVASRIWKSGKLIFSGEKNMSLGTLDWSYSGAKRDFEVDAISVNDTFGISNGFYYELAAHALHSLRAYPVKNYVGTLTMTNETAFERAFSQTGKIEEAYKATPSYKVRKRLGFPVIDWTRTEFKPDVISTITLTTTRQTLDD